MRCAEEENVVVTQERDKHQQTVDRYTSQPFFYPFSPPPTDDMRNGISFLQRKNLFLSEGVHA